VHLMDLAAKKEKRSCCFSPRSVGTACLADLKSGAGGIVTALHGGEEFRGKMLPLGIVPGEEIKIINGGRGQPYVLQVGETRLMLSWEIVRKISVSVLPSPAQRRH